LGAWWFLFLVQPVGLDGLEELMTHLVDLGQRLALVPAGCVLGLPLA
jgi:hypothetical protein